ncbi:MAG TPA: C13 family peptidase [Gammaproteobacteria bacterium]
MKKNLSAIIAVFLLSALAFTAWLLVKLDVDTLIVPPDAMLPDGSRYYGEVVEGRFHGRGRLIWPNGGRYEGEFFQGLVSGEGELRFASGDIYKGGFREGQMAGAGELDMGGGRIYTGAFGNGMPNGRGVLVEEDGSKYEGEFVDWKFHGEGTYTEPGGETYSGEFVDGKFSGTGVYKDADGNVYEGEFRDWQFHGAGVYKTAEGAAYSGNFEQGILNGEGRYENKNGERYEGEFKDWLYHGEGVLVNEYGHRYTGSFEYGYFHGEGELVFAPQLETGTEPDKDAEKNPGGEPAEPRKRTGRWDYGEFQDPEAPKRRARLQQSLERALYRQNELLRSGWESLLPGDDGAIDLYFVGVAGDGKQDVFLKEVNYIRELFDRDFGAAGRSIVLVNNPDTMNDTALATRISLERTLQAVAGKMDVERDILFLYLTSHGSEDHEFSIDQRGMALPDLPATELAAMLNALPVKWRVIAISACYSGGFIPLLESEHTLIMTAASSEQTSFGCSDTSDMTYFGKALFKEALPAAASFEAAFTRAKELVYEWETAEFGTDEKHSEPQISVGKAISAHLEEWWPRKAPGEQSREQEAEATPAPPGD